jgi:hypothetical protein
VGKGVIGQRQREGWAKISVSQEVLNVRNGRGAQTKKFSNGQLLKNHNLPLCVRIFSSSGSADLLTSFGLAALCHLVDSFVNVVQLFVWGLQLSKTIS